MICVCRQRQTDTQTHRHRGVGKESQLLAEASSGVNSTPGNMYFFYFFLYVFLHFEHDFLSKKYTPVLAHNKILLFKPGYEIAHTADPSRV